MREHGCGHRYLVNVGGIVARPDDGHGAFLAQLRRRQAECLLIVLPAHELLMARSGKAGINGFGKILVCLMVSALSIVFCLPATLTATSCTPDATPLVPTPSHCDA